MNKNRKKIGRVFGLCLVICIAGFFSLFFFKTSFTVTQAMKMGQEYGDLPKAEELMKLPEKDPNRTNILLLGGRGSEDEGDGKFLSDTIIIVSIKKDENGKNQAAVISIPRDLYVRLWCATGRKKINFAYAQGGLDCAKKTVAATTGLYIDHAINIDFDALVEAVDTLGGIDVYLNEDFEETTQWAKDGKEEDEYWHIETFEDEERWVFRVPKGNHHFNGTTTLYYARSRYSTSDFNRMQRQQQVIMAIKDRILSLGFLINPVKIYDLLNIVGKHVKMDTSWSEITGMVGMAYNLDTKNIRKKVFNTSPEGLLTDTFINKEYVLLPKSGNLEEIRQSCNNIFD